MSRASAALADLLADKWFTEDELGERLHVKPVTLRDWRRRGIGPRFMKMGARVQYTESHVNEWLQTIVETPCNSFPVELAIERPSRLNKKHVTRAEKRDLLTRETRGVH